MGALLGDGLGTAEWTALLYALGILTLCAVGFLVVRRILLRGAPSLESQRFLWFVDLVILPVLIFSARELLLWWTPGAAFAEYVQIISWLAFFLAIAWLADRGIALFVVPRADDGTVSMPRILRTGIQVALYAIAVVLALVLIGKHDAFGFVVSGSVVLGVLGLALQSTLQDAFAGVALSMEEPFKLGDWIELEDGTIGQVLDLSWRTTQLRTFEHGIIVIPNSHISSTRTHNHTIKDKRYGVMLHVHLSNEVDPAMARRVLLEAILATPDVLSSPAPSVTIEDGGSRPHRYLLYFYCRDFLAKFNVTSKVYENIWRYLHHLGLSTSPPSSDVWMHRKAAHEVREESVDTHIRNTPLFQPLNENEHEALQSAVRYRVFPADCIVVREDEAGDSLFIIAGGQVLVMVNGRTIARVGSGDYFGEMSLLTGAPRTATVRTVTETTLLEIDKAALLPILESRPELGQALAEVEARRQVELESASRDDSGPSDAAVKRRAREMLSRIRHFFQTSDDRSV